MNRTRCEINGFQNVQGCANDHTEISDHLQQKPKCHCTFRQRHSHNQHSERQRLCQPFNRLPHFQLEPAQQRSSDNPILALIPLLSFPCLPRQLLLRLLIPVRNQLVQEAAGLALVVAVFFGLFDLLLQMLVGLFIGFVGGIVRWGERVSNLCESFRLGEG